MSGTEGTADASEGTTDTLSKGTLPGESNQAGLSSYFTRPATNPIQTRDQLEAEFQTVLDGDQTENVSFVPSVNMDYAHDDAVLAEENGWNIDLRVAEFAEAIDSTIYDGIKDEFTAVLGVGALSRPFPMGESIPIEFPGSDYGSSGDFSLSEIKDEFRLNLRGLVTGDASSHFGGVVDLDYSNAPELTSAGQSIDISDPAEGLHLAHLPNTVSPGELGGAVNFHLHDITEVRPLEEGADVTGEGTTLDPAAGAAAQVIKDSIDPDKDGSWIFISAE